MPTQEIVDLVALGYCRFKVDFMNLRSSALTEGRSIFFAQQPKTDMDGGTYSSLTYPSNLHTPSTHMHPQTRSFLSDVQERADSHTHMLTQAQRPTSPSPFDRTDYNQESILPIHALSVNTVFIGYPDSSQLHENITRNMGYNSFVNQFDNSRLPGAVSTSLHQMHHSPDQLTSHNVYPPPLPMTLASIPSHSRPTSRDSTVFSGSYRDAHLPSHHTHQIPFYPSLPEELTYPTDASISSRSLSPSTQGLQPSQNAESVPVYGHHPLLTYHLPPESLLSIQDDINLKSDTLNSQLASASILMSKPLPGWTSKLNGLQASGHNSSAFDVPTSTVSSPPGFPDHPPQMPTTTTTTKGPSHSPSPPLSDPESAKPFCTKAGIQKSVSSPPPQQRTLSATTNPGSSGPPAKKKKKSKMHECEICGKSFPRPSGLRTHMNTHNNERPYPCGFPGCPRTFGVRSNAKRHLRTHGIIPSAGSSLTPGDMPYVVGFSTPIVFPPVDHNSLSSHLHQDGEMRQYQQQQHEQQQHQTSQAPFFKLRWMPPSLTSRTNARFLKPVSENDEFSDEDEDEEEEESESSISLAPGVSNMVLLQQVSGGESSSSASGTSSSLNDCTCAAFSCSETPCRSTSSSSTASLSSSLLSSSLSSTNSSSLTDLSGVITPTPPSSPRMKNVIHDEKGVNGCLGFGIPGSSGSHPSYQYHQHNRRRQTQVHLLTSTE